MAVIKKPILEDLQLLIVKSGFDDDLNDNAIEHFKTSLDPLINLNISDVFTILEREQIAELTKRELSQFTHVVSNTIDFPNFEIINTELMIPIVSSDWLKTVIKNQRIIPLRSFSPDPRNIFKEVIISSDSGINDDDKSILKIAIRTFGGTYLNELKKSLTHFISDSLDKDNTKLIMAFNEVNDSDTDIHIVKSSWVIDSIMAGKLLSESDYLLTTSSKPKTIKIPQFLNSFNFTIGHLKISDFLNDVLFKYIKTNKGEEIYLTNKLDVEIENTIKQRTFDYFFSTIFHQTSQLETDSLLYYPVKEDMVSSMDQILVATTNYTGDARLYIEELVQRMGGSFSKTLKSTNTHLVASKSVGKKFEFANSWGVKIVSHVWVEESFTNWKIMEESKYNCYPRDNNNVRFIGDVKFNGFSSNNGIEKINKQETKVDDDIEMKAVDESEILDPNQISETAENNEKSTVIGTKVKKYKNEENNKEKSKKQIKEEKLKLIENPEKVELNQKQKQSSIKKSETSIIEEISLVKANESEKKTKSQNEKMKKPKDSIWEIPDEDVDIKTDKSKPKVKGPSEGEAKSEKRESNKRKASEVDDEVVNSEKPKKKEISKKLNTTGKPYRIAAIVTGFDGTLSNIDKRELKKIGITILENPNKTLNCIIAPSLLRTQKFLTALSFDPEYFLEPLFLTDVLGTLDSVSKIGDFESIAPKVDNYDIWKYVDFDKDIKPKRLFHKDTNKNQAIENLKRSKSGLFDDFVFNLSSGLNGGFDIIKPILKSFGCKTCSNFKDSSKTVAVNTSKTVNGISDVAILVCGVGENKIQKHFVSLCEESAKNYVILEWDALVCAIFEGGITVNKSNVLQQKGVCS
jgi:hypothetical protein